MRLIDEGAEAKIFEAKVLGMQVIIKERQAKRYRIGQLDTELRETRTRREAKVLSALGKLGVNSPKLLGVGRFTLYISAVKGKMLSKYSGRANFSKIGEQLGMIHNGDVVHGDFTPANIMKSGKDYYVIDFGLAEFTRSVEDKATDVLLMKRSVDAASYKRFIKGYTSKGAVAKEVLKRLSEIEKRGRYQTRTVA
ncbi:MAG: Kae1-associated serine/threonine protein kinase [Candidatus Micrarchaeota archaeon]|nr:Kae1-associated serine/threonine protein kinase [Candidatus Micrarchaeota archaeon]